MNHITEQYSCHIEQLNEEIARYKRRFNWIYLARLVTFLGAAFAIYLHLTHPVGVVYLLLMGVLLLAFALLIGYDATCQSRYRYLKARLAINQEELAIMGGAYSHRKGGEEYAAIDPHLAADFDLVGGGSLFQYLNRTTTLRGEQRFAQRLCRAELSASVIEKRRAAIDELALKENFVQEFQLYGGYFTESEAELQHLEQWAAATLPAQRWVKLLCIAMPTLMGVWLLLMGLQLLPLSTLLIPFLFNFMVVSYSAKVVDRSHHQLGRVTKIVAKYARLIALIEQEEFTAPLLLQQQALLQGDGAKASRCAQQLSQLLNLFDTRYNLFSLLLFNPLFGFNLQLERMLRGWHTHHAKHVQGWIEAIATIDALLPFATFAHNNPSTTCCATLSPQHPCLKAVEVAHPLMAADRRVANTIEISQTPAIVVVTGANMAGKSTFLRTLAVNLLLAMNGAPVVAKEFIFAPSHLLSSIKIQDSLERNESYFYAEIVRLQEIVTHAQRGENSIIILDEILRGTNTKDKQQGSMGLLQKLMQPNTLVFVATHDLVIGELEQRYPTVACNYCFEVELAEEELVFDYKLKRGVSQKLNASFLLRKMGLID